MKVLKFGGSSVANAANINKVVAIIAGQNTDHRNIIVVSALGGITDKLILAATQAEQNNEIYKQTVKEIEERHLAEVKALIPVQQQSSVLSLVKKMCNEIEDICNGIYLLSELSARTKDKLVSYGELLSSRIITARLESAGLPVTWKDARELIVTNSDYGRAAVEFIPTNERIRNYFATTEGAVFLLPGFIAANQTGITTTLGRGGSDYTAAILAAALTATALEIWTDVSGMMTADPRLVPNSKPIPEISYREAMELSHFGAKVIYPPTIQPVMSKGIPVWVKNTFVPEDTGTVIKNETAAPTANIRGISSIDNIVLLSLEGSGMVGIPGFSKRLFETLANASVNVILITQGSSEHSICVGIEAAASARAKELLNKAFAYEIEMNKVEPIRAEDGLSIVAIVGDNMKNHSGISGKMFAALGRNGISIRAIAQGSSERNISAVISTGDVKKAVNVLHEEFFETTYKQVNLFIAGLGNVGEKLLAQLEQQQGFLQKQLRMQLRVAGIANSRRMYVNEEGIELKSWKTFLDQGIPMNMHAFVSLLLEKNLRNSIFVDMTASDSLPAVYIPLLQKSISVVACNKVAASSDYKVYKELKSLAAEFNCQFLFETNVGAGLPVIGTLNDLLRSGDKINRIDAVLSGTLNFVFNNYDGSRSFASVVKQAQEEGYTEPDPRLDLSGKDVMRKILILAREAGEVLEMDAIVNNSFMPATCMQGSVSDFYNEMEKEEAHFAGLLAAAKQAGKKLKFVARYENGRAAVGLQQVDEKSDFYHLYGKDNAVLFYTDRYPEQPLVIKGAGAGAAVTASGVFADIMRVAKV
ncbi:MAG: bifunctional aspartate kinase/homoserine dehydrogenase I [Ferruginibacter sp.]